CRFFCFFMLRRPPFSPLFPYTTLFRSKKELEHQFVTNLERHQNIVHKICRIYTNDQASHNDLFQEITIQLWKAYPKFRGDAKFRDRKSTRLNSSHVKISYAVFCLKKKK